jgi:hypothetical protein
MVRNMKKEFMAMTLIFSVVIAIASLTSQVSFAKANPFMHQFPNLPADPHTEVNVKYPTNLTKIFRDYMTVSISLDLTQWYKTYYPPIVLPSISSVEYLIDGAIVGRSNPAFGQNSGSTLASGNVSVISYSALLNGLSSGEHSLQVKVLTSGDWKYQIGWLHNQVNGIPTYQESVDPVADYSDSVYFTVEVPPTISDLSIENMGVYNSTQILLSFNVDESVSQISYILDNMSNRCLSGNTTLSVSEGTHTIVIYATNTLGIIGRSETVSFIVNVPAPTPTSMPIVTVEPSVATMQSPQHSSTISPSPQGLAWIGAAAFVFCVGVVVFIILLVCIRLEKRSSAK